MKLSPIDVLHYFGFWVRAYAKVNVRSMESLRRLKQLIIEPLKQVLMYLLIEDCSLPGRYLIEQERICLLLHEHLMLSLIQDIAYKRHPSL